MLHKDVLEYVGSEHGALVEKLVELARLQVQGARLQKKRMWSAVNGVGTTFRTSGLMAILSRQYEKRAHSHIAP